MAWDLGQLRESLILDITNFVAGIKEAIRHVDTLKASMSGLSEQQGSVEFSAGDIGTQIREAVTEVEDSMTDIEDANKQTSKSVTKMWEDNANSLISSQKEVDSARFDGEKKIEALREADARSALKAQQDLDTAMSRRVAEQIKSEQRASNEIRKTWKATAQDIDKTSAALDKSRTERVKSVEKEQKRVAKESATAWSTYAKVTKQYMNEGGAEVLDNLRERVRINKDAAAQASGGWRLFARNSIENLRMFFGEATRNFSGLKDVSNATFREIAGGVMKSSIGFAIAMAATGLLGAAIGALIALTKIAVTTFSALEDQATQLTRSLILAGQVAPETFKKTREQVSAIIPQIRMMAAEVGAMPDDVVQFTNRLVQMGHGWQEASRFANRASVAFKLAFGQSGQFFIFQQELVALAMGKIEQAKSLIELVGGRAAEQLQKLARTEGLDAAADKLNQLLGITDEQLEEIRNSVSGLFAQLKEAFTAAVGSMTGVKAVVFSIKTLLSAIVNDLKAHGLAYQAINVILLIIGGILSSIATTVNVILTVVGAVALSVRVIAKWLDETLGISSSIKAVWDTISRSYVFEKFEKLLKVVKDLKTSMLEYVNGVQQLNTEVDNQGKSLADARFELQQMTNELERFKDISKAQLDTDKARVDAGKAGAQLGANAISRAQAELGAGARQVALEKQQLSQINERLQRMLDIDDAAGVYTSKEREALQAQITSNKEAMTRLGLQQQVNVATQTEAIIMAKIANIQRAATDAISLNQAAQELAAARQLEQQASLSDKLREASLARRTDLQIEKKSIEDQIELMKKSLGTKKAESREEYSSLVARKQQIDALLEAERITNRVLMNNVAITREIAAQTHELTMQSIAAQMGKEKANFDLQKKQLEMSIMLLTSSEQYAMSQNNEIENKKKLLELDNEEIARDAAKAVLEFERISRTAEENELKQEALRILQEELARLQQKSDINSNILQLLDLQADTVEKMANFELSKKLAAGLKEAVQGFFTALSEGQIKIQEFLKSLTKSFLERFAGDTLDKMINKLVDKLEKGIESIANKLADSFGGDSGMWSSFLQGMIAVGLAALSSLFNQEEAHVEALADDAKNTIEDVERTRGLIAGETSIAIQKISEELSKALRPTNEILLRIEKNTAKLAGMPPPPTGTSNSNGGYSVTVETLSSSRT